MVEKQLGNEAYKRRDFSSAVSHYEKVRYTYEVKSFIIKSIFILGNFIGPVTDYLPQQFSCCLL